MSDSGSARRRQLLLDKFLAGEIDKAAYDSLLAEMNEFEVSANTAPGTVSSSRSSSPAFEVTESHSTAESEALSRPVALLEAGMELGGFRLLKRLRRGGMGEVWQAHDVTADRLVVVKVLPPELQRSPDEMARVKQTFNRVHDLQHQHICPVYLLGRDSRFGYFLVMKYLEGDTLFAYRTQRESHGRLTPAEVLAVLRPVAAALDYAHGRQIIHRDIKPQNIMLRSDGSDVQLVDFGLAAEVRSSAMRVSPVQMETCGTYPYMAPEQWRGELQDASTDQYALAVVAFELLTGHLPFETTDPAILRMCVLNDPVPQTGLTAAVFAVISRGMAKARTDRFRNCSELIETLAAALNPSPEQSGTAVSTVEPEEPRRAAIRPGKSPVGRSSTGSRVVSVGPTSTRSETRDQAPDRDLLDDLVGSNSTSTRRGSRRGPPSVNPVEGERQIERINARAMFWVSLIGGSACVVFLGATTWLLWTAAQWLFPASPANPDLLANHSVTAPPVDDSGKQDGVAAAPAPKPLGPVPGDKTPLRYRWEQGRQYVYSVKLELNPDPDVVLSVSGNATYSRGQPVARQPGEEGQGTGTGFVVHADGTLVTCQHVIENASEIEVAIGGQKYPATVVIEDAEHDLAILRIEARNLPVLPLADSDAVELGEEVRAIGFPFSSILGANVKATRGTISGINTEDDRKVFQVDAGINPGNSGGPLVNERGEVVGVNFAKLREEMATNVGFAVPVNDAIALLNHEQIPFQSGPGNTPRLEGPELVKRVSAATALITVKSGGAGGDHHFELHCTGSLRSSTHSKSGKTVDPSLVDKYLTRAVMSPTFTQPDIVETDPLGQVHEIQGGRVPLPGFLGPMAALVLERLPSIRRPTWSNSFAISIVMNEQDDNAFDAPFRFGPRRRPPGFRGLPGFDAPAPKTTRIPGKVRVGYLLQDAAGDLIKIKKTFLLEAGEEGGGGLKIKLSGTGVFTFDSRLGVPRQLDYDATLQQTEKNVTTELPMKLSYVLSDQPLGNGPVIPADVAVPGKAVENDVALAPGTRLVAEWAGRWLPVEVLEVKADGKVRIHWVGWGQQFDEDLPRSRLRFPAGVVPPVAGAPAPGPGGAAPVAPVVPLKLSIEEIDQVLINLQGEHPGRALEAATRFTQAAVVAEKQSKVASAAAELLGHKDPFRRKQALEVLGTWATPEWIPRIIQCLDESALLVKLAAIDTLGKLKDERGAAPLARLLTEPGPRVQAAKALLSLGTKAEKAVLELLNHTDSEVRREACRLLKEFGTAVSVPALQMASEDVDRNVANAAREAVTAIQNRNPADIIERN